MKRRVGAVPWRIAADLAQVRPIHSARDRQYHAALERHRPKLPVLAPWQAAIVDTVERQGVAQADLNTLALPGTAGLLEQATALANAWAAPLRAQAESGVQFLKVPADDIAAHPDLYRFGLQDALLDLVERYIGLPVAYDGVILQYTVADGRAVSTRKWHRDREDRRMIKLAVYLTDVDADSGPFESLPVVEPLSYETGPRDMFYLRDADEVMKDGRVLGAEPIACMGPAGTAVFADTARFFHRGKPATARDRAALFFSYFAHVPQRPYFCYRSGLSPRQIATLTEDLPQRQRAAAQWRQELPLAWRLVPPSRV
ncbi:MAG: hypothetical protein EOP67_53870 [Sphingomonas sp.]|nr:MAG: hypothetical protein EOP67_53870 [Sphingomonas sp.]